ncbi:MAG: nuclear transport factor 2 family protein [Actinomycetota bacterium]|nr:nuclear transport factor 2 family protein [Actinomycetota bacterium]
MRQDNVATIRRVYDALTTRDTDVIQELFAPDIAIRQSPELPWGGDCHGHDGAFPFLLKVVEYIESHVTTESLFGAGDHVVQTGRPRGTVRANGAPFDVPEAHLWELRDGKVVRFTVYIDTPAMLAALRS